MDLDEDPLFSESDLTKEAEIRESKLPRVDSEQDEIKKFWRPWRRSLVIKVLGKKVVYKALKNRLRDSWALRANFELLDLENGFFLS